MELSNIRGNGVIQNLLKHCIAWVINFYLKHHSFIFIIYSNVDILYVMKIMFMYFIWDQYCEFIQSLFVALNYMK